MSTIKAINIQHPSSANTNLVLDSNGNMTVAGTVVGGTLTGGMRNRIINGDMDVWQRGTSFSGSAAGSYQADRWVKMTGGVPASNTTVSQITSTGLTGFYSALRYQRNSGSTQTGSMYIGQIIESLNMRDLAGQKVTLSFYARAGANYSVASNALTSIVAFGTAADQGFTGFNAGTWTGYTQTPQTITLTSSWQRFSQTVTVPSDALEMGIYFFGSATGTAGAADYYDVTGVQLEAGTVATPFEFRHYGLELDLCKRYHQRILVLPGGGAGYGASSYYGGTSCLIWQGQFWMRTTPSASFVNNAAVQYYSYAGVWTASTPSTNILGSGPYSVTSWFTADGDGRGKLLRKNDANDLILVLDAEL